MDVIHVDTAEIPISGASPKRRPKGRLQLSSVELAERARSAALIANADPEPVVDQHGRQWTLRRLPAVEPAAPVPAPVRGRRQHFRPVA